MIKNTAAQVRMQLCQLDAELLMECLKQRAGMRNLFYSNEHSLLPRIEYRELYKEVMELKPEEDYPNILLWKEKSSEPYMSLVSLETFMQMLKLPDSVALFGHERYLRYMDLMQRGSGVIEYYNHYMTEGYENKNLKRQFQLRMRGEDNPVKPLLDLYTMFCEEIYELQMYCAQVYLYNNNTISKFFVPFSYILDRFAADSLIVVTDSMSHKSVLNNGIIQEEVVACGDAKECSFYSSFDNGVYRFNRDNRFKTDIVLYYYQPQVTLVGRENLSSAVLGQIVWSESFNLPENIDSMRFKNKTFSKEGVRTNMIGQVYGQYAFTGMNKLVNRNHIEAQALDALKGMGINEDVYLLNYPFLNPALTIGGRGCYGHMADKFGVNMSGNSKATYSFKIKV